MTKLSTELPLFTAYNNTTKNVHALDNYHTGVQRE